MAGAACQSGRIGTYDRDVQVHRGQCPCEGGVDGNGGKATRTPTN
jgi:hypothetical protein